MKFNSKYLCEKYDKKQIADMYVSTSKFCERLREENRQLRACLIETEMTMQTVLKGQQNEKQ